MDDDRLDARLLTVSERLGGMGHALHAGEPWPLAARFDHAPEASWGPPEILAHLAEMLPYWLSETERILGGGEAPVAFGRVATDEDRLAIIGRNRTLPVEKLEALVQAGIARWRRHWAELDDASRARLGVHRALGSFTVGAVAERFVVSHLEGHLDQLTDAMGGGSTAS